jgi:hypothetical protein
LPDIGLVGLRHIPPCGIDQKFAFKKFRNLDYGVIILAGRFPEFAGVDRDPGVNIVMERQDMSFVKEVPHQRVEIIGLLSEFNIQIVGENIGDFVEAFKTAIVVYHGFRTAKIGA